MSRRSVLHVGAVSGLGLALADYLALADADQIREGSGAKSAIFLELTGGPSHLDTFDYKPDAQSDYRGEFRPIHSAITGTPFPETLPKLAGLADQFCIVRGIGHNLTPHNLARDYVLTGHRSQLSLQYPSLGTVANRKLSATFADIPRYVAIPRTDAHPGFLGVEFAPFQTNAIPTNSETFRIPGLALSDGLMQADVDRRRALLTQLDHPLKTDSESQELVRALDRFQDAALNIMSSPRMKDAIDLSKESPGVRRLFGDDSASLSCLLAMRFIEAGVRFVTVKIDGWDTHQNNFSVLRDQLSPKLDAALAGLLRALKEKGLLDSTLVFAHGEFGRSPEINKNSGREHWPAAMCSVLAGGPVKAGQVVGGTDRDGMHPEERGFTPDDLAATILRGLGIDPKTTLSTASGREVQLVRDGQSIDEVFSS